MFFLIMYFLSQWKRAHVKTEKHFCKEIAYFPGYSSMMNGKSKIEFVSLVVPRTCVDFMSVMTLETEVFSFAFCELF